MRYWSSDVCSSDLPGRSRAKGPTSQPAPIVAPSIWLLARIFTWSATVTPGPKKTLGSIVTSRPSFVYQENQKVSEIGRAAFRARVCQYVWVSAIAVSFKKKHDSKTPMEEVQ